MANVAPSEIANAIMGKLYDVLTNGDETVPKSADNFFSWCTPGIPVDPSDFQFLTQGFTGVVKKAAVDTMVAATAGAGSAAGGSAAGTATPTPGLTPRSSISFAHPTRRNYTYKRKLCHVSLISCLT